MQHNRERKLSGKMNCIPTSFTRLSEYWPGVEKGKYYLVTASSGIGKSKLSKKIFVFDTVDQVMSNPEWGMDLKIFYFCLEESKVNFMQSLMSYQLYKRERIRASTSEMNSIGQIAESSLIEKVREWKDYWEAFEEKVEVIDNIRNPTGIFVHVKKWLENHGTWTYADRIFHENGADVTKQVKDHYIPDHDDRYVLVVVDHVGLLNQEKQEGQLMSLHQTISKLSSEYFLELRDKYDCAVVNVQQQAADTEKQQFTYKGQNIETKLEPSLAGLGDNKLTQRDVDVAFGIFAPDRYEIENHKGYNIVKLQDHYRSLRILKYRDGIANVRAGLFFDGATSHHEELPPSREMTQEEYHIYLGRVGLLDPNQNVLNFENE